MDEFICLAQPELFYEVGQWYRDSHQINDEEVPELLRRAWERKPVAVPLGASQYVSSRPHPV